MARKLSPIEAEYRVCAGGDPWGDAMHAWFTIADEVFHYRECAIPYEWRFRPSPLGPVNDPDDILTAAAKDSSDDELMHFGRVLFRYCAKLRRLGCDY